MFEKIKKFIILFLIKRKLRKSVRSVKALNLRDARSIGILYTFTDEGSYSLVTGIIHKFSEYCREVKALGYVPLKAVPSYMQVNLKTDVYLKNNLNLIGLPKQKFYTNFTDTKFDLLIDLSMGNQITLNYIAALSKSSFKVGYYHEEQVDIFDFMIKNGEGMNIRTYTDNIVNYLSSINMNTL